MGLKKLKTLNNLNIENKRLGSYKRKQIFKNAFHCFTLLNSLTTHFSQKVNAYLTAYYFAPKRRFSLKSWYSLIA